MAWRRWTLALSALAVVACATGTPTPEPLPAETPRPLPGGRLIYFDPADTPTARQEELAARTAVPGLTDARDVVPRLGDLGVGWTQRLDPAGLNHRGWATANLEWEGDGDAAPDGLRIVQCAARVFATAGQAEDERPKRWRQRRAEFPDGFDHHGVPPSGVGRFAGAR
jgi:hypothetical protein